LFTSGGVLVAVTIFWLVALSRVIPTLYAFSEFFIPAFLIPGVLFLTAALAYLPGQDSELGPIRKERVLAAAGEGAILAGRRGPLRQW